MEHNINQLYGEYYDKLFSFIKFRVNNSTEIAEEITNDVFVKAYNKLDTYSETEGKMSTWLYTIAKNSIIDYYRRSKTNNTVSYDTDGENTNNVHKITFNFCDSGILPDGELEYNEKYDVILNSINKMPKKLSEIFLMRFIDEQSYEYISETLNLPLGTVKANIHRAKILIKKSLAKHHLL